MSETTPRPQPTGQPVQPLAVNIQYVKDLSFEVPGAPQIYTQLRAQPQVSINLDVQARRVTGGPERVRGGDHDPRRGARQRRPRPTARPQCPAPTVFVAELTYAGVFTLQACRTTRSSRCCWWNARASCSRSPATSCPT